jgi:DNA-binding transcriptional regulator GbsR (MarR family)
MGNESPVPGDELQYVEDVGLAFESHGLPRMMGRVLGWLLIADPPQQTFAEIAEALGASKGSISTATRGLIQTNLIERISIPGHRRDFYRLHAGGWSEVMQRETEGLDEMRRLAEEGLKILRDAPPERRRRLEEMRSLYAFFHREMPALIERWQAEFAEESARGT